MSKKVTPASLERVAVEAINEHWESDDGFCERCSEDAHVSIEWPCTVAYLADGIIQLLAPLSDDPFDIPPDVR